MAGSVADATSTGGTVADARARGSRVTGTERAELAAALGRRYAAGESVRAIAQDTGRSFGFVHGLVKEAGVPLRARGGPTRGVAALAATVLVPPQADGSAEVAKPRSRKGEGREAKHAEVKGDKAKGGKVSGRTRGGKTKDSKTKDSTTKDSKTKDGKTKGKKDRGAKVKDRKGSGKGGRRAP